jgi:hypothetical protein
MRGMDAAVQLLAIFALKPDLLAASTNRPIASKLNFSASCMRIFTSQHDYPSGSSRIGINLPLQAHPSIGHESPRLTNTPTYIIIMTGAMAYVGAIAINYIGNAYEHASELLNFGAFLAFMGVNLSVFWQFTVVMRKERRPVIVKDMILPPLGFGFCALIWWSLNTLAKTVGGIWFLIGLTYLGVTTRCFLEAPKMIDFKKS